MRRQAAVGLHWPAISAIGGRRPYFLAADTVHAGCRDDDEHLAEVRGLLAMTVTAADITTGDPDGRHARLLAGLLAEGLKDLGSP
jgi:arginase